MSNVYVLNKSEHDFSSAERYGTLKFINEGSYNIFNTRGLIHYLSSGFENFNAEEDYLIMSGSPVVAAFAFAILLFRHPEIRLLLFDAKRREYVVRTVDGAQCSL